MRTHPLLDGTDCARGIEANTRTKRTGSDNRYRCKSPGAKVKP